MRRFELLLAKEGPKGSGGSPRDQGASGTSWVAPEASPFLPVDEQSPKYGQLVRLKFGGNVVEGLRDPFGWFAPGHNSRLEGEPDGWLPLEGA